jgi:hypothetical protein
VIFCRPFERGNDELYVKRTPEKCKITEACGGSPTDHKLRGSQFPKTLILHSAVSVSYFVAAYKALATACGLLLSKSAMSCSFGIR